MVESEMADDLQGWTEWCRQVAADYRRGARRTKGQRSDHLSELAAHYDAQAGGAERAFSGNKPRLASGAWSRQSRTDEDQFEK
jgi:hypothetical protein